MGTKFIFKGQNASTLEVLKVGDAFLARIDNEDAARQICIVLPVVTTDYTELLIFDNNAFPKAGSRLSTTRIYEHTPVNIVGLEIEKI